MAAKVTDRELFDRCYASTHRAADELSELHATRHRDDQVPPEKLKLLRDTLREAYCAVQELKSRMKKLNRPDGP